MIKIARYDGRIKFTFYLFTRFFSSTEGETTVDILSKFKHGRKNSERKDSVTTEILEDRRKHFERISIAAFDDKIENYVLNLGLGSKKRKNLVYKKNIESSQTQTAAGGFALHLSSASSNWPIFKHMLPEIAFAGHSNCGKSTLINAMTGVSPRHGPAGVSDRAGWTDQICFYQLGKRPPLLTLVDFPGYGHAVASDYDKKKWKLMVKDYLSSRLVLSACFVLVDSTRGLCSEDINLIKFLNKRKVCWRVVLTKGDLLTVPQLAGAIAVVQADLQPLAGDSVSVVSAATGAGVGQLWSMLDGLARASASEAVLPDHAVKEHKLAAAARRPARDCG